MKLVFFIMNSKGKYVLKEFIKEFGSDNIAHVVTADDAAVNDSSAQDIIQTCFEHNIKSSFKNDFDSSFLENNFYIGVAIGWRWILNFEYLNNLVVLHDSLLPAYRGFSPLVNSLVDGESQLGVTAIFAEDKYDTGNILATSSIEIKYPIKISEAIASISPVYYDVVKSVYLKLVDDPVYAGEEQSETEASYSLWLDEEDYYIDWKWSAIKIARFVNAVDYPFDNARFKVNGKTYTVKDTEVIDDVTIVSRKRHIGKCIFKDETSVTIVCGEGLLTIKDMFNDIGEKVSFPFRTRFH